MSSLSDTNLQPSQNSDNLKLWYITKQNLNFRDLAMMASILEMWNDNPKESFQTYFDRIKKTTPFRDYIGNTPHRALKNCEFYGLMTPANLKSKTAYSSKNLTESYQKIKQLCKGNFQNIETYQFMINNQLEQMNIKVNGKDINPIMYALKVLLILGDATGSYKISVKELKLFVCTCDKWNQFFQSVESIIRFRTDKDFEKQAMEQYNNVNDTRFNLVFNNLSYISSGDDAIAVKKECVKEVREKVAEFELGTTIEKRGTVTFNVLAMIKHSPNKRFFSLLSALRTKPFMLLAGISGTGKSRNVRKLAQATVTEKLQREYDPEYKGENFEEDRWKLHKPANFEIIQVKPNWHNSMDVVGYLSNIPEPHYVFTPFVHFIVKAWQNPDVPFFLCLDEMNLAPVEEYFAEYLSAIESRGFENGEYETDPIIKPFKEFGEENPSKGSKEPDKKSVCDCMLDALLPDFTASDTNGAKAKLTDRLRNKGLTLPQNLIVIGTVNMDETTFSFSRKVLDRAMSIEMNEVDYEKFILGATDDDIKNLCSRIGTEKLNRLLVKRHIEAEEVITELGGTMEGSDTLFVINYLESINKLLDGTPFKLGYRASNEALIYLAAAKEFGCQCNSAAMDDFTLMKILSRIEGDESKLKLTNSAFDQERLDSAGVNKDEAEKHGDLTLLTALREIIKSHLGEYQQTDAKEEEPQAEAESQCSDAADDINEEEQTAKPALLRSIRKIDSMISQLARDHFVSYWN